MKDARGHGSNTQLGPRADGLRKHFGATVPEWNAAAIANNARRAAEHSAGVQEVGQKPKFTQKHFEMIAGVLANHAATVRGSPIAHDALVAQFADKLSKTNPKFDKVRFSKAAGGHYP